MPDDFRYDVFLSHSTKDKAVVRPLAERSRKDGVKVWSDEWGLKPGDSIPAKIERRLEHSRVLVLCMSADKQSTLLIVKRPGVTDTGAKATTTLTFHRRTLLQ